jgi:hypothetical protein
MPPFADPSSLVSTIPETVDDLAEDPAWPVLTDDGIEHEHPARRGAAW